MNIIKFLEFIYILLDLIYLIGLNIFIRYLL